MSNSARLGGITSCTIDGVAYVLSSAQWNPYTIDRKPIPALSGFGQYSEMPSPPTIKFTLLDGGDFSVANFQAKTNSSIQIVLANGKVVYGQNMYFSGKEDVDTGENPTFTITFTGLNENSVYEVTA